MIETQKVIQAIHYLLCKLGEADKIKIIKLIYLADKYHITRHGRTITGDDYYAMEFGPVGTTVKDVLSSDGWIGEENRKSVEGLFEPKEQDPNKYVCKSKESDFEMLSESDEEAIDFVIKYFTKMDSWELVEYTHRYPEWDKHKDLFKTGKSRREQITNEDLLSVLPDDPLYLPEECIEEARKIVLGIYE